MALPIELAECIIDASRHHPPTLATCSLVCKRWLPRSRHHLFSSLDLSADWNPEPNSVTEFLKIIDSPKSTLIPYVTTVVLSKRSWGMTPIPKILAVLARSGIRPELLHINCPTYEPVHLPIFSASLVHLTLHLHNDMPMATLIDHICAFPLLESLYIGGSARFSEDLRPMAKALPPKFHALVMCNPVFAHWVLSLDVPPMQISTLVLRYIRLPDHWAEINQYLCSPCASGIRSLTFQGCDTSALPQQNLYRLEDLQELVIEGSGAVPAAVDLLNVLAALCRSPVCMALEMLDLFAGTEDGLRRSEQSHWHAADAVLANTAVFPRLRCVRVRVRVRTLRHPDLTTEYPIPGALGNQLCRDLAFCHRRQILFVG
ncbi:hypothetical protein DFH07DRAFT_925294 [Mycena maculata]|uniref:F-box domain-containing protein n=1 Tax=Mycena maculata TaxID=230809 RepID=A0AAD7N357_9AGAR|nr:hypothetical protein DFH07DRAFT_925294 [Mycena maculata]